MLATRSRQWATKPIKECIQKGFVLNDEMLKNGKTCGMFYDTEWVSADVLSLKLDELNHNDVYENVVRPITGNRLSGEWKRLEKILEEVAHGGQ